LLWLIGMKLSQKIECNFGIDILYNRCIFTWKSTTFLLKESDRITLKKKSIRSYFLYSQYQILILLDKSLIIHYLVFENNPFFNLNFKLYFQSIRYKIFSTFLLRTVWYKYTRIFSDKTKFESRINVKT